MINDNRGIELQNKMLTGQVITLNNKVVMLETIINKYEFAEASVEKEIEAKNAQIKAVMEKTAEYRDALDKEKSRCDKLETLYNQTSRELELTREKLSVSEENLFSVTKDLLTQAEESAVISEMFRHIAMGRRIWMHIGSHEAAKNIAFVFSLIESCRLNNLNFGDYIEDVLNRVVSGDRNYESMIPCNYKTNVVELDHQILKKA